MKTIMTLVATAALIAGISAANAQGTTKQMDEQAGGNSGAVERNPNGSTGGTKANPSPTTGSAGSQRDAGGKRQLGRPQADAGPRRCEEVIQRRAAIAALFLSGMRVHILV